jgi:hypothetical protein
MKRFVVSILSLAAIFVISSSFTENDLSKSKIRGVYVVGSLGRTADYTFEQLEKDGILNFGAEPFNFLENDTVLLSKECGERFFGDTSFKYEFSKNMLVFTKGDKKIEMPYTAEIKIIRITIDNKYLTRLDLVPARK